MKLMPFLVCMLVLLCLLVNGGDARSTLKIPKITIKNGDIIVHGNCNGCTARATKNTAQLSIKLRSRTRTTYKG
ncbi:uncharacterized protein LOC111080854 [Drosophila obscura]|uniref:uncharacterized protein LOC111080854 n=1 Tax=Drosophila obscura TaxID=7282 RepID=UPI001BB1D93F|nr:uncharacterized protein LOC111080854 [Drosophila obscura]